MVEFKYQRTPWATQTPGWESHVSSLLQLQLHYMMKLLESSGTQVKIFGLTISVHNLTCKVWAIVDCLRCVFHQFPNILPSYSTWHPSYAECTAASHLIPAALMSCYADACISTAVNTLPFQSLLRCHVDIDELFLLLCSQSGHKRLSEKH